MESELILPVIILVLLGGLCAWIAWISIQSLLQASVLRRTIRSAGDDPDKPTAIYGPVEVDQPVHGAGMRNLLYCKITHQEYVRYHNSGSWRTVGEEEEMAAFSVSGHRVAGPLTEIHSVKSRTEYDRGGCLGGGLFTRSTRTLYRYLPAPSHATVLGRLDGNMFVKDNKVGLLVSPHPPSKVAFWETVKGIGGLLAVTVLVGFGIWLYYQIR